MRNFNKQQFIEEKKKEYMFKFNDVVSRIVNLEVVPDIQSRINERIPERGGFTLYKNEELEELFEQALNEAITKAYKQGVKHLDELLP